MSQGLKPAPIYRPTFTRMERYAQLAAASVVQRALETACQRMADKIAGKPARN